MRSRVSRSQLTSYRIAATAGRAKDTSRVLVTVTRTPAGETHSTCRLRVPARRSRVRSCRRSSPVRTSNGSSSTYSCRTLPFGASTTVSVRFGKPYPSSGYARSRTSKNELRYVPGMPCGSASSRLPRSPMCPLLSANTDSA
jgi:hypothetical protein